MSNTSTIAEVAGAVDEQEAPPRFKESKSTTQKILHAPKKAYDWLVNDRFGDEHWFGSLTVLLLMQSYTKMLKSAQTRLVNGKPEPDTQRVWINRVAIVEKGWSFFSGRGGELPEGKTLKERLTHVLKHPNKSSSQFEFLFLLPGQLLTVYNNARKGLKAHGIGLKENEEAFAPEKIRLYASPLNLAMTLLIGYGHFRKRPSNLVDPKGASTHFRSSDSILQASSFHKKLTAKQTWQKIWQNDRVLLAGMVLNVILPFVAGMESWMKRKESQQEAVDILKASAIGASLSAAHAYYTFQRIAKSNFVEKPREAEEHYPRRSQNFSIAR